MKKLAALLLPLSIMACSQLPVAPKQAISAQNMMMSTQTLGAYSWQLIDAKSANGTPIDELLVSKDKPITLNFTQRNLHVSNTCNRINGAYALKQNTLTANNLVSTMMACDDRLNKADQAISSRLEGNSQLQLKQDEQATQQEPTLTLITASKDQLTFKGIATAETRYGSQGVITFLEIAPETKTCSAGVMQKECLQVREIRYNEQGLKTFTSPEWTNFYDNIEGYQHNNSTRQILRVKKYTIKNPPADASSNAYVLDMVVETELVKP
jgi:heat shock protein HslJ